MPRPDLAPSLSSITDDVQLYTQFGDGVIRVFTVGQLKSYLTSSFSGYSGLTSVDVDNSTGVLDINDGVNPVFSVSIPDINQGADVQSLSIDNSTGIWNLSQSGGNGNLSDAIFFNSSTKTLSLFGKSFDLSDVSNSYSSVKRVSSDYIAQNDDDVIVSFGNNGSVISLPIAPNDGRKITIKQISVSNTEINGNGNLIDDSVSNVVMESGNISLTLVYDSSMWVII